MPNLPEYLQGCPAKRGLAACHPRCADAYPGTTCLFVYTKKGLLPPTDKHQSLSASDNLKNSGKLSK